jgi:hypothetical protein
MNPEVSQFLSNLNHPLKNEIDQLRQIILSAEKSVEENIKWNGPNYTFLGEDRITMRVQPISQKQIQLIFHRGAKKQDQPKDNLIQDSSGILVWKEKDRAIATFKSIEEMENKRIALESIIQLWLKSANSNSSQK